MLTKIKLENFRQHLNLELDFKNGVTVLRGSNEQGKTTVFEAVAFALFGVKACRNNDLTTWGEPDNSHKVTLDFTAHDEQCTITRTKSSAELQVTRACGSVRVVTGQTETVKAVETMLGLKPGLGSQLMFVGQSQIQGILAEGGAKTTSFIEKLADLDVIDNLVTELQDNYPTGKTLVLDDMLESSKEELLAATIELKATPDPTKMLEAEIKELKNNLTEKQAALVEATAEFEAIDLKYNESKTAEVEYKHYVEKKKNLDSRLLELKDLAFVAEPVETDLTALKEELVGLELLEENYKDFVSYKDEVTARMLRADWTANFDRVSAELVERNNIIQEKSKEVEDNIKTIAGLSDICCKTCKREFENAAEQKALAYDLEIINEKLNLEIEALFAEQEPLQVEFENLKSYATWEPELLNTSWTYDKTYIPAKLVWKGQDVSNYVEGKVFETRVSIVNADKEYAYNVREYKIYKDMLSRKQELSTELEGLVEIHKPEDSTKIEELRNTSKGLVQDRQHEVYQLGSEVKNFEANNVHRYNKHIAALSRVAELEDSIARCTKSIEQVSLNNLLLKSLRAAKPLVADKIWRAVCETVSIYFSQMRGVESVVSKDNNEGFTVNGEAISSLSGSTLSILGLALRVALVKTFLPSCDILLLDEPFDGADSSRRDSMLGFIVQSGFMQMIIITHENSTESFSDELLLL